MTAKEKLLERAPRWIGGAGERALRAAEGDVDGWWDLCAIERLSEVIVAPLTTTVRGLPNEVEPGPADGLPRACVTSFNLSTIASASWSRRSQRLTRRGWRRSAAP